MKLEDLTAIDQLTDFLSAAQASGERLFIFPTAEPAQG